MLDPSITKKMQNTSLAHLSLDCWIEICSFLASKKEQLNLIHCCTLVYDTIGQNEDYFFATLCSAIQHCSLQLISSMSAREYYFRFPIFHPARTTPTLILQSNEYDVVLNSNWTQWMQQTKILQKKNIQFVTFVDLDSSHSALNLANTFIGIRDAFSKNDTGVVQLLQFPLPIQHFIYQGKKKQTLQQLLVLYPSNFYKLPLVLKTSWMHFLLSISSTLVICSDEEQQGKAWRDLDALIGARLEQFPLPKSLRSLVCFTASKETEKLKLYNPFPEMSQSLAQEYQSKLNLSSLFMASICFFGKVYGIHYQKNSDIPRDQLWNLMHQCLQEGAECVLPWPFQETSIMSNALDGTFFSQFITQIVPNMGVSRTIDPILSMEQFVEHYITNQLMQDYCNYYNKCLESEFFIPDVSKPHIQSNGVLDMQEFMEQNQIHEEATLKLFNQAIMPLLDCKYENVLKDKLKSLFLRLYKTNQHGSKILCEQVFKNCFSWKEELLQAIQEQQQVNTKEVVEKMERRLNESVFGYLGKAKGLRKYLVLHAFASDLVVDCIDKLGKSPTSTLWSAMLLKFKTFTEKVYLKEMHNLDAVRSLLQNQIGLQKKMICMENELERLQYMKQFMLAEIEAMNSDIRYLNQKQKWEQFYKTCSQHLSAEIFENFKRMSKEFCLRKIKEVDNKYKQCQAELLLYQQKYSQIKTVL